MIRENEFPILEYSTEYDAVINPAKKDEALPRLCIMTFFRDVFESFISKYPGEIIGTYASEMREFHAYRVKYKGIDICIIQADTLKQIKSQCRFLNRCWKNIRYPI